MLEYPFFLIIFLLLAFSSFCFFIISPKDYLLQIKSSTDGNISPDGVSSLPGLLNVLLILLCL